MEDEKMWPTGERSVLGLDPFYFDGMIAFHVKISGTCINKEISAKQLKKLGWSYRKILTQNFEEFIEIFGDRFDLDEVYTDDFS